MMNTPLRHWLVVPSICLCLACHSAQSPFEEDTTSDSSPPGDSTTNTETNSDTATTFSTDSDSETGISPEVSPRQNIEKALVVVVDDSLSMANSELSTLYAQYPKDFGGLLADLYNQPLEEILSRDLSEIAEDFGENWIIEDILGAVGHRYAEIDVLTDDAATFENILDAIYLCSEQDLLVDLVLIVHGSQDGELILFDGDYPVDEMVQEIEAINGKLSAVYQTVCYADTMIASWESIAVHAVNGSQGENIYINFAPGAFLRSWIAGEPFNNAVQNAREYDITELRTRLGQAAADNMELAVLLSLFDFDAQSIQQIGGVYPAIGW